MLTRAVFTITSTSLIVATNLSGINSATAIYIEPRIICSVSVATTIFPSTLSFVTIVFTLTDWRRIDGISR